jgi:hypothetical protein
MTCFGCRCNIVSTVTTLRTGWSRDRVHSEGRYHYRLFRGYQSPFLADKAAGTWSWPLASICAEIKNEWNCGSVRTMCPCGPQVNFTVFKRVRKIAKSDYSFVMSAFMFVRPHETTRLPLVGFSWNFILEYFSKICWENSSFIKIY